MAEQKQKRRRVAAKGNGTGQQAEKSVTVVTDVNPDASVYYVNHMEVSHTPHDFSIAVAQLPPKLSAEMAAEALKTGVLHFMPLFYLTIPPTMIDGLVNALTVQKSAYERSYGPIKETNPAKEAVK